MRTLILSGRLGSDAEVKVTQTGTQYMTFRMANNERGDEEGRTYWFRVTTFNPRLMNLAQYLTKGKSVEVIGTLRTNGYVNATTNKFDVGHDITADSIMFDSNFSRPVEDNASAATTTTTQAPVTTTTPKPTAAKKPVTRNPTTTAVPTPQAAPVQAQAVVTDDGADDLPF